MHDIGSDSSITRICLVVEDLETRIIRYLKIDYNDGSLGRDKNLTLS